MQNFQKTAFVKYNDEDELYKLESINGTEDTSPIVRLHHRFNHSVGPIAMCLPLPLNELL